MNWRGREYFQHVHQVLGDAIHANLHEGVLPQDAYSQDMPDDVRHGATGVPVIDQAVRQLYFNGYVHNHARLWIGQLFGAHTQSALARGCRLDVQPFARW